MNKDIEHVIRLLRIEKNALEQLMQRSIGKYEEHKLKSLQAEIDGLEVMIIKNEKLFKIH